jgi:hypothetical protein
VFYIKKKKLFFQILLRRWWEKKTLKIKISIIFHFSELFYKYNKFKIRGESHAKEYKITFDYEIERKNILRVINKPPH